MLKEGMYFRCKVFSIDSYIEITARYDYFSDDKIVALAFENDKNSGFVGKKFVVTDSISSLRRVKLKKGSQIYINNIPAVIIEQSTRTNNDYYYYWCRYDKKIKLVSEKEIIAKYDNCEVDVEDVFIANKFSDYSDYLDRYEIEKFLKISNSITCGYEGALNNRIDLYEHQIDTVQQVLSKRPYRAILADEVGLGKTIETLVIISYLLQYNACKKVIIIVPDQLVYQWYVESTEKFGLEAAVFYFGSNTKKILTKPVIIIGFSDYVKYSNEYIFDKKWDMMVVDEAHKLLKVKKVYSYIYKLCCTVKNKLLLSATPIMQRHEEYFKLLRLLKPEQYENTTLEKFSLILDKRFMIDSSVAELVSDIRYTFEEDDLPDYISRLYEIANRINDKILPKILSVSEDSSMKEKKRRIRMGIVYLQKTYELNSPFIRHRRSDILDESSKRILSDSIGFYLKGEDNLSQEFNLYKSLTDEIKELYSNNYIDAEIIIQLVNAFFSSPIALLNKLIDLEIVNDFKETNRIAYIMTNAENKTLNNSRLEVLINCIKNRDESEKIVVFSDFKETVDILYKTLCKEFGKECVIKFSGEDSEARMHIAANAFEKDSKIRILISDEVGAEGRNFQFADTIIHYDIPWSPAKLEQRIGRLDRIGRLAGKKVNNIVLYVKDTVEEDLFILYDQYLNIFNESLSGIEIIFDDLWNVIKRTVQESGLWGFSDVYSVVTDLKEKCSDTLYEEMLNLESIKEDDLYVNNTSEVLVSLSNVEKEKFYNSVFNWHYKSGYGRRECRMLNDIYNVSSYMRNKNSILTRKYQPKITENYRATFNINKSYLSNVELLNLHNPVVEAVINSLQLTDFGKAGAFSIESGENRWMGYIITWSIEYNELDNMLKEWSVLNAGIKNDYVKYNRLSIPYCMKGLPLDVDNILEELALNNTNILNLKSDEISELLDYADIESTIQTAIEKTKEDFINRVNNNINFKALKKKIRNLREEIEVCKLIKSNPDEYIKMKGIYESILNMLLNFDAVIESIIFVNI